MSTVTFPFREITNSDFNRVRNQKKPSLEQQWKGSRVLFPQDEALIETEDTHPKALDRISSPFSFAAPALVSQPTESDWLSSSFDDEYVDENDENVAPEGYIESEFYEHEYYEEEESEEEEDKENSWEMGDSTRQAKWCGSRIFFSSSESEDEEAEEYHEYQEEQMKLIETTFIKFTTD